jgi:hypothetical protein
VHLVERQGDFEQDLLWLLDSSRHNISPTQMIIRECTPSRLVLLWGGLDGDVVYDLERVAPA